MDHLAVFLRWTPQLLLPPVREILRGGAPEGKVPLRMFFQASVHHLRRRSSVRRVRPPAVVSIDPMADPLTGFRPGFESVQIRIHVSCDPGIDACRLPPYTLKVVKSFRHPSLKTLYEGGRSAKIAPSHLAKLGRILTALDRSNSPEGMDLPGFRLHSLKGRMKGHYAVSVSGNWRVTFRFEDGHAVDADYLDYH